MPVSGLDATTGYPIKNVAWNQASVVQAVAVTLASALGASEALLSGRVLEKV
jgi:hypothetical protein